MEGVAPAGPAQEHIAGGRDEEAVAAPVKVLRMDRMHDFAMVLPALTYLLIQAKGHTEDKSAEAEGVL